VLSEAPPGEIRFPWLRCSFVFLFTLIVYTFLTQNLPFTIGDDLNVMQMTISASWPEIFKESLNPISPAWHVNDIESVLSTRSFNTLILKGLYEIDGLNWEIFHFAKSLFLAFCAVAFFLLVFEVTRDSLTALLTSLMIVLSPPVYESVSWIVGFEVVCELFILLSFYFFFILYGSGHKKGRFSYTLISILFLWSSWWALENKETAKMIPIVLCGFLALRYHFGIFKWLAEQAHHKWLLFLAFAPVLFMIPRSIPEYDKEVYHKTELALDFEYWKQFLNRFQDGQLGSKLHGVIAHPMFTLSLLISVVFFVLLVLLLAKFMKNGGARSTGPRLKRKTMVLFALPWLALSALPLLLNLEIQRRYFMIQIIPFSFLAALFFSLRLGGGLFRKAFFSALLILFCGSWCLAGFGGLVYLRRNMNQKDVAGYEIARTLYRDVVKPDREVTMFDVMKLYASDEILERGMYNAMKVSDWDHGDLHAAEALELLRQAKEKTGNAYLVIHETRNDLKELGGTKIATVSSVKGSVFGWVLQKLGWATPAYEVYRF